MDPAASSARPLSDGLTAASSMVSVPSSAPGIHPPAGDFSQFSIPEHELLRPIASGAYGEVWLARNVVGTLRAVKIVRRDRHESVESFEREFKGLQHFEPASRSHEGLVDILTLGLLPDHLGFYYVMELADNASAERAALDPEALPHRYTPRTLRADLKARGALPAEEVIALGLKLTSALQHLHERGLVHRDVKPTNILFIGGKPKLADAGLVAAMDDSRSLVGTAGYIAPEGPGSPQGDLYALGKVLYEAVFGKDRREFPSLPADVASRADHARLLELNEVIGKACASDPRERYANASAMFGELVALEAGHSIKRQRARHQIWTHAKSVGLAAAGVAILVAVVQALSNRVAQAPQPAQQQPPEFVWSTNELANEDFRKGVRSLQGDADNLGAIQHFESAIQKDPNFAEAYARLAWAHYSWGDEASIWKGPAAAEKAVELNPKLAYAHSMLATAKTFNLKWTEADNERRLAISLNPTSQEILLESALNLASMGRTNEALIDLQKARRANPDSASELRELFYGFVLGWCREYHQSLKIYERFPNRGYFVENQRAQAYLGLGDYTNAMRSWRQAALLRGESIEQVTMEFAALDKAFKEGGQQSYWQLNLEFESMKTDPDHLMRMAAAHARLNQPGNAFHYLKRAMRERPNSFSLGIYANPSFDSLRKESEFQELISELWNER